MTPVENDAQTDHQPSTDALDDDWLDPWLCFTGGPLRSLSISVSKAIRAHDEEAIGAHNEAVRERNATRAPGEAPEAERRAPKASDRARLDEAISLLTCNLAHVALLSGTQEEIAYSRRKGEKATRYDNPLINTDTFRAAIERMGTLGLLEDTRGEYQDRSSTLRPTDGFLSELEAHGVSLSDLGHSPNDETIILKNRTVGFERDGTPVFRKGGKRVPYVDTDKTRTLRAELGPLNDFLASADIAFVDDDSDTPVDTSKKKLRRFFAVVEQGAPRFDKGGRLFGGWWQNLKKHRRPHIRIDGEECAILDYAAMFPRLAYSKVNKPVPEGDLYDLTEHWRGYDHTFHRKGIKVSFNSLFFGRGKLDKDIKASLPKGATLPKLSDAIRAKHPALGSLLSGSLVGFDLMMDESTIILGVCGDLAQRGIVSLPIHDAIIVKHTAQEQALQAMMTNARRVAGFDIPVNVEALSS